MLLIQKIRPKSTIFILYGDVTAMDIPNVRICLECGREITEDYGFCPACGAVYRRAAPAAEGSANERSVPQEQTRIEQEEAARIAYQTYMEDFHRQVLNNNLKMTVFMIEIWIGMAAFMIAGLLSGVESMQDTVRTIFGVGNNREIEAAVIASSALLAAVSASLCWMKKYWNIAFTTCLASALVTSVLIYYGDRMGIYFLLCGLLTTLRIKNIRAAFQ